MAHSTTHGHIGQTDTLGRIATLLKSTAARMDRYRTYRRTLVELRNLSDRDLDDLGINRSMVRSIALDSAYGTR